MKEYEEIRQIFNECPNNKTRDTFFAEIMTDDLDEYIKSKFQDKIVTIEKTVCADGSIVYEVESSGMHQRYTYTEI